MLVSRPFAPRLRRTVVAGLFSFALVARIDAQTQSAQSTAPQAIPTKLSDSAFWRLVTDFSESNGFFRSDNFVSNESSYQCDTAACQDGPHHEMTSRALWGGLMPAALDPPRTS